jgi:hypothetical protein
MQEAGLVSDFGTIDSSAMIQARIHRHGKEAPNEHAAHNRREVEQRPAARPNLPRLITLPFPNSA